MTNTTPEMVREIAGMLEENRTPINQSLSINALRNLADQLEIVTAERDAYKLQYGDLVFQVSRKFKDETRHQTAKRYIVSWEGRTGHAAIAKEAK